MKKILGVSVFLLITAMVVVWGVGGYLSMPVNQAVKMPTAFDAIIFNGTHGSVLRAESNRVCALLMHGVRSNRSSMIKRSVYLKDNGITSLLIDLQGHGETPGSEITFGLKESRDAANGLRYLQEKEHCDKVVAIGQSLGGASALLGDGPVKVNALILESVYPTIEEAVEDRLEIRFGKLGRLAAPLLYWQIPLRINTSLDDLKPIDALKKVKVPVFIISGTKDQHTKVNETQRLYEAANETKQLWLVDGAAHEDLFSYAPAEYQAKVMSFIKRYLY